MNPADIANFIHIKHPDRLFIGGEWVQPSTDAKIELVSPMTEEVVFKVAEAKEADMDRAVAAPARPSTRPPGRA